MSEEIRMERFSWIPEDIEVHHDGGADVPEEDPLEEDPLEEEDEPAEDDE